jgi:hypothetical protein
MVVRRMLVVVVALAAILVTTGSHGAVGSQVAAVPLSSPTPAWYTSALHSAVVDAGARGEGVALPDGAEADIPASGLAFTGIRPGSWMLFPAGCTLNFVFGSPGQYAIGTAGHCTSVGEEVSIVAAPGVLMNIGTTVKSVDNDVGDDFALISIRPEMQQHVRPSMAHFGGPTGAGDPQLGGVVQHSGHGLVLGTGGTPRAGVVVYRGPGENRGSDAFAWVGAATPGDSGSPVTLAGGSAAGNLTHLVVGGPYVPGDVAGTSISRILAIAGMPLATAPAVPNPL